MEYKNWFTSNFGKIAFFVVLLIVTGFSVCHYISVKSHFEESCERICTAHENLCKQLPAAQNIANKDSVFVRNTLLQIKSSNAQIKEMLELQHGEIQEDFAALTLWASVLMVVFLIFSIYSMYRVDDLVNQGRNSVSTITNLSAKAQERINEVDILFDTESKKLAEQSTEEIEKLKQAQLERLQDLETTIDRKIKESERKIAEDIKKFNESVDGKSKEVLKQFESLTASTLPLTQLLTLLKATIPPSDGDKDGDKDGE